LAESLEEEGYQLQLHVPNSEDLPPPEAYVYVLWDRESSEEAKGWYLCQVLQCCLNGSAQILYLNTHATEVLDLRYTPWHFAKKSAKKFPPPDAEPPESRLKKVREQAALPKSAASSSHKVKGFADDLTVISRSLSSHQRVLVSTVSKCMDLDLHVRPDKYISILYNGNKLIDDSSIQLQQLR
jgi:hypothetical protein